MLLIPEIYTETEKELIFNICGLFGFNVDAKRTTDQPINFYNISVDVPKKYENDLQAILGRAFYINYNLCGYTPK